MQQWSKLFNYNDFIIVNNYSIDFYKKREIKKRKRKLSKTPLIFIYFFFQLVLCKSTIIIIENTRKHNINVTHLFKFNWMMYTDKRYHLTSLCLAFDFCRFCVVIRFSHHRHNGQWSPRIFLSQILSITLFSYLNSWERASISLFNVKC